MSYWPEDPHDESWWELALIGLTFVATLAGVYVFLYTMAHG